VSTFLLEKIFGLSPNFVEIFTRMIFLWTKVNKRPDYATHCGATAILLWP